MFTQIANLIKIALAFTVISFSVMQANPAYAGGGGGGGGGDREFQAQQKMAKELKTAGTPSRTRAKIIASVGLFFGTIVGEAATTTVTCIADCLGANTGYKAGDLTKQSWKGFKKMWGMDTREEKRSSSTRTVRRTEAPRRSNEPSIGTSRGSVAINPDR